MLVQHRSFLYKSFLGLSTEFLEKLVTKYCVSTPPSAKAQGWVGGKSSYIIVITDITFLFKVFFCTLASHFCVPFPPTPTWSCIICTSQ